MAATVRQEFIIALCQEAGDTGPPDVLVEDWEANHACCCALHLDYAVQGDPTQDAEHHSHLHGAPRGVVNTPGLTVGWQTESPGGQPRERQEKAGTSAHAPLPLSKTAPNKGIQATAYSVRFCVAPASSRA
jgi:hypothetical protein